MSSIEWFTPSGSIGTVSEGTLFSFFFSYTMLPLGNIFIVSGNLPTGLTFNANDSSIIGTVGFVEQTTTFTFTVRLQNDLEVRDRSFSITVTNTVPSWITPETIVQDNSQSYRTNMLIDKKLQISNPSNLVEKYEIIAGNLPEGLSLREDGRLVGFVSTAGSYFFTAKVVGIEKTFFITIVNDAENRPPFWSTIDGYIGDAISGTIFNFDLSGFDVDPITFSIHPSDNLPDGLILNGTNISGNISPNEIGNKFFRINIDDGIESVTRTFYIRANLGTVQDVVEDIIISPFLSEDGNSTLLQDEPSYLKIQVFSTFGLWTRHELSSGSLPSGFVLDISSGEIQGSSIDIGTYDFEVKSYNNLGFETYTNFSITVAQRQEYFPNKICSIVTGPDRVNLNLLYNNDRIPYDMIYRAGDKNFGTTLTNEILIHKYVSATKTEVYDILENRIGSEATAIKFKNVPVQNSLGQIICECVLLVFKDYKGLETVVYNGNTIETTSLDLLREKLSDLLSAPLESFVNWQSEYYTPNIQNDIINVPNHDMYTGKIVYFRNQNIPSPFLNNTVYYAIVVDDNNIRLANSKQEALSGNFIRFNVNEVPRSGILHTPHNAIPFVYCKTGFGERVSNSLNNAPMTDIKLYFKHFVYGPTTPNNQEDLELVWFEAQRI